MTKILPSIFGADLLNLEENLRFLEKEKTEILHIDMMDGNYVQNIAFGPNQIEQIKNNTSLICDVHMMVSDPYRHIDDVINTGVEMISVHYESTPHLHALIQKIKSAGIKAGIVLNPQTPIVNIEDLLDDIDYVLIMTINPGQAGQVFIKHSLKKIKNLKKMISERPILIQVDGGVNVEIAKKCKEAGADLIVVGGALFANDKEENYKALKKAVE